MQCHHSIQVDSFLDAHDFVNAWLTMGVGELTSILGKIVDPQADKLAMSAMRAVGMSEFLNIDDENMIILIILMLLSWFFISTLIKDYELHRT